MSTVFSSTSKRNSPAGGLDWIVKHDVPTQSLLDMLAGHLANRGMSTPSCLPQKLPEPPPPVAAPPMPDPVLVAEQERRLDLLAGAIVEMAEVTKRARAQEAEEVVEIALAIAEALAAGAIEADPTRIIALVKEALDLMGEGQAVKVHLHPVLFEQLSGTGRLDALSAYPHVAIHPDARLEGVGCIVESAETRVDARVEARIRQLRHLLNENRGEQG